MTNNSFFIDSFSQYKNLHIINYKNALYFLKKNDIYLTIGGSMYQITSTKQITRRFFRILKLFLYKIKGIKLITLGINLGPFKNGFAKLMAKIDLFLNNNVTVRDKYSYSLLCSNFKAQKKHIIFAEDIVYSLNIPKKDSDINKNNLGISAYRIRNEKNDNVSIYNTLSLIIDEFIEITGNEVKLFSFDTLSENDIVAAEYIYKNVKCKEKVHIVNYLGNYISFLEEIETCSSFIAIRFHSAILSSMYGIPFLPVIYSNKMRNLIHDNNFNGTVFDLCELKNEKNASKIVKQIIEKKELCIINGVDKKQSSENHFSFLRKLCKNEKH